MTTQVNRFAGMRQLYYTGDKIMVAVLAFLLVLSFALAGWYDTWSEAVVIGVPSLLVPAILFSLMGGLRITRIAVGAAFMIFSALLIHQAHGMIEMHFAIFVLLAFLLVYRDWLPIIVAAAVIAVHHLTFNYLQAWGYPVFIFNYGNGLNIVLIHAAFVVFESAVLIYLAMRFHQEALQAEELREIGPHLAIVDGVIDLNYRQPDAQSDFARDFNTFMDALNEVVGRSKQAATQINTAMKVMRKNYEQANGMSQQQRGETDQVATAVNEMAATVQEVAKSASNAADAANKADSDSRDGQQVVKQSITQIGELADNVEQAAGVIEKLNANSDEIGAVVEVIKGIADQTNLLALNAAIEAARAGEQGRGFAVVADEVRTLASRTQASTEEIQNMIEKLQTGTREAVTVMQQGRDRAKQSVEQASDAGSSLEAIAMAVTTINEMNVQIATAAEQQSQVAEEISRSVTNIRETAEEAAQTMRQTNDSTVELDQLAQELQDAVERFRN